LFTDYHSDTYGVNIEHEVQGTDSLLIFSLYCPRDSPQWKAYLDRSY
jgi:hypothetical protein